MTVHGMTTHVVVLAEASFEPVRLIHESRLLVSNLLDYKTLFVNPTSMIWQRLVAGAGLELAPPPATFHQRRRFYPYPPLLLQLPAVTNVK